MAIAGIVCLLLAIWFAAHIPKTIAVFVIAAFLASAAYPIVALLVRWRLPRLWAIAVVYAALILLTVLVLLVIVPLTVEQVQGLIANIPSYLAAAQSWAQNLQAALNQRFPELHLPSEPVNLAQLGGARIAQLLTVTISSLGAVALDVATGFFIAFSAIILSFFFLLNYQSLADGFAGFFPPSKRMTARKLSSEAVGVFGAYIAGQVIVSSITGVLITALCAIAGFKYALIIGLLSAIGYAIPIIGMLIVQVLALAIAAPQGVGEVIATQIIIFLVARVSDNVFVPKIMGGAVGVSPIAVMFAVFAGGELFGLPGLILGIPAAAVARLLWRYFLGPWLHGQIDAVDSADVVDRTA